MSSGEGSQADADIVVLRVSYQAGSILLHNYLATVALTILYYDYFLTFAREIDHFWKRANLSLAAFLFVLNRYLGLLGNIPVAIEYFWYISPQSYHAYYTVASQVIVGLLILRTYVLYSRSIRVLTGLVILGVLSIVVALLAMNLNIKKPSGTPPPSVTVGAVGCDLSISDAVALRTAVGWIGMIYIDTIIFVLTVVKAMKMASLRRNRLFSILFRDGAIYYVVMAFVNTGNLLTLVLPNIGYTNRGLLTTFTNALCTTITSRILLNLRDPELKGGTFQVGGWPTERTSQMIAIRSMVFTETSTQLVEIDLARISDHEALRLSAE